MGKRYLSDSDGSSTDKCHYCGEYFEPNMIYGHESNCEKNPAVQNQDEDG